MALNQLRCCREGGSCRAMYHNIGIYRGAYLLGNDRHSDIARPAQLKHNNCHCMQAAWVNENVVA